MKALSLLFLVLITAQGFSQGSVHRYSAIIPLGISSDGRYIAYLERFIQPSEEEGSTIFVCAFFIVDVPMNKYAISPLYVQAEENFSLYPGLAVYSFQEYELRKRLMAQAEGYLKEFGIQVGIWPSYYWGIGVDDYRRYYELIWHEGGGHGVELLVENSPYPDDPEKKMLDLRLQVGQASLEKEMILQKDTRFPGWRSQCTEYRIAAVYFFQEKGSTYIVTFLRLTLEGTGTYNYNRFMCVTGDVTEIWEAALSFQPDFSELGH